MVLLLFYCFHPSEKQKPIQGNESTFLYKDTPALWNVSMCQIGFTYSVRLISVATRITLGQTQRTKLAERVPSSSVMMLSFYMPRAVG